MTKEEYYESVQKTREIAADPKYTQCSCPKTHCEWHGKCKECVAIHRYNNDHIPACLQPIMRDKVKALLNVVELVATPKADTPSEFREYAKERDAEEARAK